MAEIQAEMMADWTTDDTHSVDINEESEPAKGALKNPSFPDKVGSDEDWTGSIDACNIGETAGTFRLALDGKTSDSFDIPAGSCGTLKVEGTGPAEFTIKLQRRV